MLGGWELWDPFFSPPKRCCRSCTFVGLIPPLQPELGGTGWHHQIPGGVVGEKRDEEGISPCSCAMREQQKATEPQCSIPTPRGSGAKGKAAPLYLWGAARRTISDGKEGEAASLRGGFSILLLSGDELSLLQGQVNLLLRVVVVELADVGDEGPGEGV